MNDFVKLTPTARLLLAALVELGGTTSDPINALSQRVGMCESAIKVAVGRLEEAGLITVARHKRNHHAGDPSGVTLNLVAGVR
jgi:DNA-binding MarR family transcriptional regulator